VKTAIFFLSILAALPLAMVLRSDRRFVLMAWIVVGTLPFVSTLVRIRLSLLGWEEWTGHTYGIEISIVDIVILALLLADQRRQKIPFPHFPFLLFGAALSASMLQAPEPIAASFSVVQYLRFYFICYAVTLCATDDSVLLNVMRGMALGLLFEAGVVFYQRFGLGIAQPAGTFIHQNSLGLFSHFVTYPQFALLLAGETGVMTVLAPIAGALIAVLTASRGASAFTGLGFIATLLLSFTDRVTPRKMMAAGAGVLALLVLVPLAVSSWQKRIEAGENVNDESVYDERAALNMSASLMLDDYPLGVGANNYSYVARNEGYAVRGGIVAVESNLGTNVHNVFWLMAAETGYPGIAAYMVLLAWPLVAAVSAGWRARRTPRGMLSLGFAVSLAAVYGHSTLEWILLSYEGQVMLSLVFGLVFAQAYRVAEALKQTDPARQQVAEVRVTSKQV
jgi:O-antigen ligase